MLSDLYCRIIITCSSKFRSSLVHEHNTRARMSILKRARAADETDHMQESAMVTVQKDKIPTYLHSGEFYQSLHGTDNEILVPRDCFQMSPDITNSAELEGLLKTLRFWVVADIPDGLLKYACTTRADDDDCIYDSFEKDLTYLERLRKVVKARNKLLCAVPNLQIVGYLLARTKSVPSECVNAAACGGNLDCLKLFREHGAVWSVETSECAADGGHLECLRYLHETGCP